MIRGDVQHLGSGQNADSYPLQRALSFGRQVRGEGGQNAIRGLDQKDLRLGRIDAPEVAWEGIARHLGDAAGQLNARRPCAYDHEREERDADGGVRLLFSALIGGEDAAANLKRFVQPLQIEACLLPAIIAEEMVLETGGDDQRVIAEFAAGCEAYSLLFGVNVCDLRHEHAHVIAPAKDAAQGRGDVCRREAGHGHLVEQRPE